MSEELRDSVKRLISDSLKSTVGQKLDYTKVDLTSVCDLYKRQIEHLGCTNVKVTAGLQDSHDTIDIYASFTPPPSPIVIEFTVQTVMGAGEVIAEAKIKKSALPPLLLIVAALVLVCFWWVPLYLAGKSEREACEKTETCEVCSVTSTGFSYDCKPDPKFGKNVKIRRDAK